MRYRALFYFFVGLTIPGLSLANEVTFCQSICESQQRECRANAAPLERAGLLAPSDPAAPSAPSSIYQRNPLARTAAGAVPGQGSLALRAAGDANRRLDRAGACDDTFQGCRRSCGVQAPTVKPVAESGLPGKHR